MRRANPVQQAFWRAFVLCADLSESTYQLATKPDLDPIDLARLASYCEREDKAWLSYRGARDEFIALKRRELANDPGKSEELGEFRMRGVRNRRLSGFVREDRVGEGGEQSAQDRRHPEQPELLDRPSTHEKRRPRAARGIHREVRDRDPDQMDQRET